jgi:hypothetical protein
LPAALGAESPEASAELTFEVPTAGAFGAVDELLVDELLPE